MELSNTRWPGLDVIRHAPVHAAVAKQLVRAAITKLPLTLTFPNGAQWGAGGPTLHIRSPRRFFTRLGSDGLIGFGEAWMTGDLTTDGWVPGGQLPAPSLLNHATDRLTAGLTVLAQRMSSLVPRPIQRLRRLWQHRQPAAEENTHTGAKSNISRHYDLSNDLFATFLDPTLTYSAAYFAPGDDLERAQVRKIDAILDLAGVQPGMRVLEIGSGWGSLAMRAAATRNVTVTTLTLSAEQRHLAQTRIAEAGLGNRIDVRLEDYRAHGAQHAEHYDALVSVEMIEAVGEQYWPAYFGTARRVLKPGRRFALQAITIPDERLRATRGGYTWVHKYIFPGGQLPSLPAIDSAATRAGLRIIETRSLGLDYARTLQQWRHRFNNRAETVTALGFDETFLRMWNFYLAYSQAGFAARYLDDWQLAITSDVG